MKNGLEIPTLRYLPIWLRRITHCRGFGIQSPWAYRFVRYVVNEHYPYYAYAELKELLDRTEPVQRKLSRLYFRIANYRQADHVIDYMSPCSAYDIIMKRGCRKTAICHLESGCVKQQIADILDDGEIDMLRMSLKGNYESFYDLAVQYAGSSSLFILEGIYSTADALSFWQRVVNDVRCSVTFDLYYCGVVFFNKKLFKTNYIINF